MSLDKLAREGARRMLAVALEAEVDVYLAAFAELVDEHATGWCVANGHAQPASLRPGPGRSRSSARAWMAAGWIQPPAVPSHDRGVATVGSTLSASGS
jgi:hypothetical protein